MKCAKSRKAKKSASPSGSLGTTPGCRSASSETMRGDAEPTWCTCSSALGRREMKPASADMALSMSAPSGSTAGSRSATSTAAPEVEPLPVQEDRRRQHHTGGAGGFACRLEERGVRGARAPPLTTPLSAPASTAHASSSASLGAGARGAGLAVEEQLVKPHRLLGVPCWRTAAQASRASPGVALSQMERAVLHQHIPLRRFHLEKVPRRDLEVPARCASEVLEDDDLRRRIGPAHDQCLPAGAYRRLRTLSRPPRASAGEDHHPRDHRRQRGQGDEAHEQPAPAVRRPAVIRGPEAGAGTGMGPA